MEIILNSSVSLWLYLPNCSLFLPIFFLFHFLLLCFLNMGASFQKLLLGL